MAGEYESIALDHGNNWYSCQFHPESRKSSWDIYYGAPDAGYMSAYAEHHDGQQFISNFFQLSA